MKRRRQLLSAVMQAFSVFTVLNIANGQTTCNQGSGRVMYERLPNQQLQGFDDEVVRDTAPPFRVLEKCQDLCLRDRAATGNNLLRTCSSFDFQPGSRIASFSGAPEYEESTCYLTREQAAPEGIGSLMLVPNTVHFSEICLKSDRPERQCPSRRYVFERHPRKKLKLPSSDLKEVVAANRSDCQDKCLEEFSFVCRSASYDSSLRSCSLSRFTRRTHPELLMDEPNSDYLENTCLTAERRCDGLAVFVKEENKRLGGPFEVDIFSNLTLEECQDMCLRAEKYFCRSVEFDEASRMCILSEEDSVSQKDDITVSSSPTHHFYDLVCLDNPRGSEYPDNSVTSHLFSNGRRPDTAFQRYRNSRLGGEFHSEITGRSLSECLDECLRQTSFQCRSAVYSDRFRTCRLSRYNQRDGMRIIYDADYDYYENLMHHMLMGGEGEQPGGPGGGSRPDMGGSNGDWGRPGGNGGGGYDDRYPGGGDRDRDRDRYPGGNGDNDRDRYPGGSGDRYPGGDDKYPDDRNQGGDRDRPGPGGNDRYPGGNDDRYPGGDRDRYPDGDRYPAGSGDRDRYPIGDRYPGPGDRYPAGDDRYPAGDRFPNGDRYPIDGDRYPGGRFPPRDRYPGGDRDRYPDDRYPTRQPIIPFGRYPPGGDRYPIDRPDPYPDPYANEIDRYPIGPDRGKYPSRYPPGDRDRIPIYGDRSPIDRYPGNRDRYPIDRERYPIDRERYPIDRERYPTDRDRYPINRERYPIDRDRYPMNRERYPNDRYPDYDRYPNGNRHQIGSGGVGRYPYDRPPGTPGGSYWGTDRYGGDRYGGGSQYDRERDRFGERDSFGTGGYGGERPGGDRYGGDRYGGDRFAGSGGGYGGGSGGGYSGTSGGFGGYSGSSGGYGGSGGGYGGVGRPAYGGNRRPAGPGGYRGSYGGTEPGYRPSGAGPGYDPSAPSYVGGQGGGGGGGSGYGSISPIGPGGLPSGGGGPSGPGGSLRPVGSRCDSADSYRQVGSRQRMRRQYIRRFITVQSLVQCQRECAEARDFICRSFNYRDNAVPYGDAERDNCELSDRDTRDMDVADPAYFDTTGNYDFYERSTSRSGEECLDVSQVCNEDGMEFTLQTPEGFIGRIYTYGFYDRCFFRGSGGTANVLRISGAHGYPECGTQRYGDTMTNIVVVQFSDNVQTGKDKRFNLTCLFRGPGEAVVTSNYIGAGSGSPIPIEYLPAENSLSSRVRLMILYQGRPTTTIAVGDPLTFRLESQDGYNYVTDIFATNVIARDPYSGRSVQLIDRYGCPVDSYVFPELDKGRSGDSLEARFNAFKIPESNFLVFEATVRTCREGCQPAFCSHGTGRSEPSFGRRRRRDLNGTVIETELVNGTSLAINTNGTDYGEDDSEAGTEGPPELPEHVREMIEVFESRDEMFQGLRHVGPAPPSVCLSPGEYHSLLTAVVLLVCLLFTVILIVMFAYRRYWGVMRKNQTVDRERPPSSVSRPPSSRPTNSRASLFGAGLHKPFATGNLARVCDFGIPTRSPFEDPSEPIYTDPSLFERSRSLRSLDLKQQQQGMGHRHHRQGLDA